MKVTEMKFACENKAQLVLDKIEGKKKNPDFYKNQKEARMLLIMRDLLNELSLYTEDNPLKGDEVEWFNDFVSESKRSVIEINEGDNYMDIVAKYIDKTNKQIMDAADKAGLKLTGMIFYKK